MKLWKCFANFFKNSDIQINKWLFNSYLRGSGRQPRPAFKAPPTALRSAPEN